MYLTVCLDAAGVVLGCCRRSTRMLQAWYYDAAGVVLGCCRGGTRMLQAWY